MKRNGFERILITVIIILLVVVLFGDREVPKVEAQSFGTSYLWSDSLLTRTAAQDSNFTTRWQQLVVSTDTISIWYRAGAPDVTSWSSRDWIKLDEGASLSFGPATPIQRFEWKADAGVGVIFFQGYKKIPQY